MKPFEAKYIFLPAAVRRLWSLVPVGGSLPEDVWRTRHRFLLGLAWFHAVVIALIGPVLGYSWELSLEALFDNGTVTHTVGEGLIVAFFTAMACWRKAGRTFQATAIGFGLMSSSAILVHLSGGYIELHFHFFVMLVFMALYQDWVPYGLAVLYVAVHHGVVGVIWPTEVYNHPAAINAPWTWAGIHAFFVLWSCVGSVIAWRLNEAAFAETERRAREQEALNAIATATSRSLDLKELFEVALDKTVEVTGRESVNIRLKDTLTGKVELVAYRGFTEEEIRELRTRTRHPPTEQVFVSGAPLIINDAGAHRSPGLLERTRSIAWIPIKAGAKVVGVLGISDDKSRPFLPSEVDLLQAIGSIIGVAIENARLFGETKRSLEGIRALHEIDMAITSTLDLHDILAVLLEKIDLFLPYSTATVRLFNKGSGLLEPVACRNLDEKEWKIGQGKAGRGPANVVFETRAPMMIRNCHNDPRVKDPAFFRKHALVSYLGVPMVSKEEILGVLSFYTKEEHEFTSEEVEFLSTLAGQAAIAIHNSEVYEEMAKIAGELAGTNRRLERSLGELSSLYTALTPLAPTESISQMMDGIIERLVQTTGADAALIRLWDRASGTFKCTSHRGFPDSYLEMALTIPVGPPGSALAEVCESGEPVIVSDIAADPRLQGKVQLKVGLRSCAFLPLKVGGEVRGIVHLSSREVGYFSEEQRDHLLAIARQMGIMMENRDLFDGLRTSRDELDRANKVKDEFLSVMSHELRTPLNVVMGYTAMVRDGLLGEINPEQEKALEKVISRTRDQLTMISSILQAVHMEAEGVRVERREVGVRDFLDDLRSSYSIPLGKDLPVIWDYSPDLPVVHTDVEKLKHVLQNLINNAIKFTEKGHVTISARCLNGARQGSRQQAEGSKGEQRGRGAEETNDTPTRPGTSAPLQSFVEFKVTDTGVGIPEEALPIIFERFRQVDSSETRAFGGVGIGLYIVKEFTELLGGEVAVESEPGKGSTFTVTIPVAIH